ncbi:hypothetical protein CVT26_007898 [Gymnopilus dilepis]|uniref:Uncharacterized protein n=1 Tax=Gymnopilus dilepis TaxID=231916 RepID=A0A409YKD7_9AGAR|nr:hypothetical protein CVT26_007898 [Gymnopilus dilepis]
MERHILSQDAYDTIAATVFCTTALDNKWTSIDVECFGKDSSSYNLSYISFSSSPIFRRALIGILARIFSATVYGFTLSLSIHCLRVLFKNSPKDPKEAVAHNCLAGYSILFLAFGTASLFDNFRLAMYDLFGTSFDDKHFREVPIGFHMNTNTYAPLRGVVQAFIGEPKGNVYSIRFESCAAVPLSELSCIILSHRSILDGALAQLLFFGLTNICAISTLLVIVRIGEGNDILSMQRPELEA